jgi:hypothetical protein
MPADDLILASQATCIINGRLAARQIATIA